MDTSRIVVLGLGYLGCVSDACLAKLAHHVTGVDRDEHKVRSVLDAQAPFLNLGWSYYFRKECGQAV